MVADLLYRIPEVKSRRELEFVQKKEGDGLTFYEKYEKLRQEKGVSNYRVSEATGISEATLSEWKNGKYSPKIDSIRVIAKYFDVPFTDLIGD